MSNVVCTHCKEKESIEMCIGNCHDGYICLNCINLKWQLAKQMNEDYAVALDLEREKVRRLESRLARIKGKK